MLNPLAEWPRDRRYRNISSRKGLAMVVFKTAAVAAVVLVSMSAGAGTPATHSQVHSNYYSRASHSQSLETHGKDLPRSTVAPSPTQAATAGSVRTHVSEIDQLERQSSVQLAAERKHEARPAAGISHVARSEGSARGSSINFSYHSPRRVHTGASSGSGGRRP